MKTTQALYRQDPAAWAHLPYGEALKLRIVFAQRAMNHYRSVYDEEGYANSEKAVKYNRELIKELIK